MNAKFVGRVMALTSAVLAMLLPAVFAVAQQEQFPTRPITLIVPFAPGGATDIVARLVAVHVGEDLGQSFVIDNRAGGANVGTHAAARKSRRVYARSGDDHATDQSVSLEVATLQSLHRPCADRADR